MIQIFNKKKNFYFSNKMQIQFYPQSLMNLLNSERTIRKTVNYYESTYKLEPWGQSSQLPLIVRKSKGRNSVLHEKQKNKLSLHESVQKEKKSENVSPLYREASVYSFSYAKKNRNPKLDQNMYRPKSIKNIQLVQDNIKKKLKKRLNRKQKIYNSNNPNINSNFPDLAPKFSTVSNLLSTKVQKVLEIERKIFRLLAKDKS